MRRALQAAIGFTCAYLLFLALEYPAARLLGPITERAPQLALSDISGTLLAGRIGGLGMHDARIEALAWDLRPLALLLGRIEAAWTLGPEARDGQGRAGIGFSGAYLSDVDARIALPALRALVASTLPLPLQGMAEIKLARLALDDGRPSAADGSITLRGLRLMLPEAALGDIKITLETAADGIAAHLADQGGPLALDGLARLKPDGAYTFTATLSARNSAPPTLAQSLALLGTPGPDGKITLRREGQL
jgi:general secretion pathway protein N